MGINIPRPEWFDFNDLAIEWDVGQRDIVHLVETGKLKSSFRVRMVRDDEIKWLATDPSNIYDSRDYRLHGEFILLEEVERFEKEHATESPTKKATADSAKESTRTIETLQKALVAVAMDCYGYDPDVKGNTAVRDIQEALDKIGLSISENTIRTHLKAGAQLIPQDKKA